MQQLDHKYTDLKSENASIKAQVEDIDNPGIQINLRIKALLMMFIE